MSLTTTQITTDHERYGEQRAAERARVMPIRAERRIPVGDLIAFEFENEDTLRYQVQEMVYVERITDPAAVGHEVEVYGRFLPNSHELCATMLIELEQDSDIRAELGRLSGIQHAVKLEIADPDGGRSKVSAIELRGVEEDLDRPSDTVSLHVVRFTLSDDQRDAFRDPSVLVELVVDHPEYSESTPINGATRLSLLADLALISA